MNRPNHIYTYPLYYEVGFTRSHEVEAEVKFSLRCYKKHTGDAKLKSILDNGCGTGCHLELFGKFGVDVSGYDASPQMVDYAATRLSCANVPSYLLEADLRDFRIQSRCDMAICMNGSFQYLLSPDDAVRHLKCVGEALKPGGLYLISLPAPQDFFSEPPGSKKYQWSRERGGISVHIDWTYRQYAIDWGTQTFSGLAKITVDDKGHGLTLWMPYRYRIFFPQEIQALVRMSRCFEILEVYGGLHLGRLYSRMQQPEAMNVVLRKTAEEKSWLVM